MQKYCLSTIADKHERAYLVFDMLVEMYLDEFGYDKFKKICDQRKIETSRKEIK